MEDEHQRLHSKSMLQLIFVSNIFLLCNHEMSSPSAAKLEALQPRTASMSHWLTSSFPKVDHHGMWESQYHRICWVGRDPQGSIPESHPYAQFLLRSISNSLVTIKAAEYLKNRMKMVCMKLGLYQTLYKDLTYISTEAVNRSSGTRRCDKLEEIDG